MSSIFDWSLTPASNANSDSGITWVEGQLPGTVNGSARAMMGRVAELVKDLGGALVAGGTANALTITANSAFTTNINGRFLAFRAASDNTTAATLNVNGIGAKSIRKMAVSGDIALSGAEIQADGIYLVNYSEALNGAAGGWQLLNPTIDISTLAPLASPSFTGVVTITSSAPGILNQITSTDAGVSGVVTDWFKDSASPAANDFVTQMSFSGRNSAGTKIQYSSFTTQISDPTAGSEDSFSYISTYVAGANGARVFWGAGQYMGGATGGDMGAGTVNATAYYINGVAFTFTAQATAAQYRANTAGLMLTTDKVWAAAAEVTLTDAATIAVDFSTFINAVVTLGGNRAMGNPTNEKAGQSGVIRIVQDGTGTRTLSYGTDWEFAGGTAPVLSTAAGAQDLLFYHIIATDRIFASLTKAIA